jgi:hypothetical protein
MSALELRDHLLLLRAESAAAVLEGASALASYHDDLQEEIRTTEEAYTCAVLTEIATFRAEIDGPQLG